MIAQGHCGAANYPLGELADEAVLAEARANELIVMNALGFQTAYVSARIGPAEGKKMMGDFIKRLIPLGD